jgi:hypothetical protein
LSTRALKLEGCGMGGIPAADAGATDVQPAARTQSMKISFFI